MNGYDKELCIFGKDKVIHDIALFFRNNHLGYQKSLVKEPTRWKPKSINYYLRVYVTNDSHTKLKNYIKVKNVDVKVGYSDIS